MGALLPLLPSKNSVPVDLAGRINIDLTQQCVDHVAREDRHEDQHKSPFSKAYNTGIYKTPASTTERFIVCVATTLKSPPEKGLSMASRYFS